MAVIKYKVNKGFVPKRLGFLLLLMYDITNYKLNKSGACYTFWLVPCFKIVTSILILHAVSIVVSIVDIYLIFADVKMYSSKDLSLTDTKTLKIIIM